MTVRTRMLVVVAALAALAVCVGPAQSAFPGGNGKIVFASDRDGAQDVYVMTSDGVKQRRLTTADGDDQYPMWSPDGNQIVFSSARETASSTFGNDKIFRMNADGSAQTRVIDSAFHDLEPSWSPNMARIAFRSNRDGGSHIFAMNANGTGLARLTDVGFDLNPVWSPTADSIAFASDRDGDYEILTMDGNGDNETPLTNNADFDSNPDWSPDGSKITFQSNRDGDFDVWVMDADGNNPQQLTNDPAFDSAPTWSPDGTMLAFQSNRDGDFDIYTMNADGTGISGPLTVNSATDRVADWQPLLAGADTTPPVLTLPGDITEPATSSAGAVVSFFVFATDNVDPNPTVTCSPESGATFAVGTTTVSCTASDGSGNWSDGTFTVTVLAPPPNTPEGTDVIVTPVDATTGGSPVTIRFSEVTVAGDTTLTSSSMGPPPPSGFLVQGSYYELATTAQFDIATVCFQYTSPPAPTIGHYEGGAWVMLTTTEDTGTEVCAVATSFSPFALLEPVAGNTPTGSNVVVEPVDETTGGTPVTVTFANVTTAGDTTLASFDASLPGKPEKPSPPACTSPDTCVGYALATTALFDSAEVCFDYAPPGLPAILELRNVDKGDHWPPLAVTRDTGTEACVEVTSLGTFAVVLAGADSDPPVISCGTADGIWHDANVSIACAASDSGSGLANASDASFLLTTSVSPGTEDGNASTGSRQVCDVAGNCATAGPVGGNKIDRKAPALVLPSNLTVDATSPAGALVSYAASASDGADPSPSVSCAPASGSVFAIGTTNVQCAATDHVGNSTSGSFAITVRGAKEQLNRLIQKVVNASGLPPALKSQLISKLQSLVASFDPANAKQKQAVCVALNVFKGAVQALSGRGIPPAQAAEWIADANRIRAVLGC